MKKSRGRKFLAEHGKKFIILFVVCLIILVYAVLGDKGFVHLHRSQGELRQLQERIAGIEEENRLLRQEIKRLKTDPAYIEHLARQDLGMLRENEVLFLFRE